MRIALALFFLFGAAYTARAQGFSTSDSLCHITVPASITTNCANADCRFWITASCDERAYGKYLWEEAIITFYNRWGQQVHEIKLKDQKGWDGGDVAAGVYFWSLTYFENKNGAKEKRTTVGSLTIIK